MYDKEAVLKRGEIIYNNDRCYTGPNERRYADEGSVAPGKYILTEERFISGHDDTAIFVEIIDADEKVMRSWKFDCPLKKYFADPDYYEDDCLIVYLMERFSLPAVGFNIPE